MNPRHMRLLIVITAGLTAAARPSDPDRVPVDISGVIWDDHGRPVPGAQVYVVGMSERAMTNADGFYRLTVPQPPMVRPTTVRASAPGFFPEEALMMLGCHLRVAPVGEEPECSVTVNFSFRKASFLPSASAVCRVTGQLRSAVDDSPIWGQVAIPGAGTVALSDKEGAYTLDLPAGLTELEAFRAGMYPQRRLLWVACRDPQYGPDLDFTLYVAVIE